MECFGFSHPLWNCPSGPWYVDVWNGEKTIAFDSECHHKYLITEVFGFKHFYALDAVYVKLNGTSLTKENAKKLRRLLTCRNQTVVM